MQAMQYAEMQADILSKKNFCITNDANGSVSEQNKDDSDNNKNQEFKFGSKSMRSGCWWSLLALFSVLSLVGMSDLLK